MKAMQENALALRPSSATPASGQEYKVGWGRPPKEFQFKPGQSENPKAPSGSAVAFTRPKYKRLAPIFRLSFIFIPGDIVIGPSESPTRASVKVRWVRERRAADAFGALRRLPKACRREPVLPGNDISICSAT
jgi:hypothetical protein